LFKTINHSQSLRQLLKTLVLHIIKCGSSCALQNSTTCCRSGLAQFASAGRPAESTFSERTKLVLLLVSPAARPVLFSPKKWTLLVAGVAAGCCWSFIGIMTDGLMRQSDHSSTCTVPSILILVLFCRPGWLMNQEGRRLNFGSLTKCFKRNFYS
jgi:hypothetical protein